MATPTQTSSFVMSDSYQRLPMELALRIIDILFIDLRDSAPAHARSLLLVSRSVYLSLLPLLYEVVVVDDFNAWDGRFYGYPYYSLISCLMRTPFVPERLHIKTLTLSHHYEYYAVVHIDDTQPKAEPWSLDNIIVSDQQVARELALVEIRARAVHQLILMVSKDFIYLSPYNLAPFAARLWREAPKGRSCIRLCTQPVHDPLGLVQDNCWRAKSGKWASAFSYRELDPCRGFDAREYPEGGRGVFIIIDVGPSDGFSVLSVALLDEVAMVFNNDTHATYHVVLVYPRDEKDNVVRGGAEMLRTRYAIQVHARLWVTRSSADRKLIAQNPYLGIAWELQRGIDPWDTGKRVSEFVLDRQEE